MKLKEILTNLCKGISSIQIFPRLITLEDINPNYSNKYSPNEQDLRAICDDWKQIGQDMGDAIKKFGKQYN